MGGEVHLRGPDDVLGVQAVFAGDVAQRVAVGVRRHAGDVARRDAQAGQAQRQRVLATRHRQVYQARALRALAVGGGVAHHRLAEGDEGWAATGEAGQIIFGNVEFECVWHCVLQR
ncbi:MAG: hypothetical protein B6I36_10305 [Desulfobacteraceae bacterium 4572_35.1]|nr:MAG: hypothetical protein B6I36_10305 [Desulfobacteraceae bacterium 4572_35.1]